MRKGKMYLIRDFFIFIEQHLKLSLANCKIFHSEIIRNIPANSTKFSTVLDNCMEETKAEKNFLELVWFFAVVECFISHASITSLEISSKTLRWFQSHFYTILQNRNREIFWGHWREPQTKIFMHIFIKVFYDSFELWHPWNSQVTILKEDPSSSLSSLLYHSLSLWSLTLTQWYCEYLVLHLLLYRETLKVSYRIRTGR